VEPNMKSTRSSDVTRSEEYKTNRRALLQTAAAISAGFAAAGTLRSVTFAQDTPQAGGTLTVGLQAEPSDNIDPHVTPWAVSHNIMMNVYDTLVWQDPADGSFKAGLAESWEAAPDGMSYNFKLRAGVKFHDGTDFNADAVKFAFDRIIDPATKSGFSANLLGPYSGTDIIDASTVKINFSAPYAPFLDSASQAFLGMVSPAAVAEYGAEFGVSAAVGTGPFMFQEWVRGDHLTLVKNPDYNWQGAVFEHTGPAYLDEIIFRFIPEDTSRTGTLQSGETNVIELVPTGDIQLLTDDGYQIIPGKAPGIPTIYLINTAKPPTDELAVRQAMNLGTDQQAIIDAAYFGVYDAAAGPLAKVSWAFNPDIEGMYAYDPEAAKALLDGAGWVMNGDFREKAGQKLTIEYLTTDFDKHSELWQSQMREIGIEANIQMVDNGTWIEVAGQGAQNITIIGWISSDPVILEHLFHSKNVGTGFNWSFFKNTENDDVLVTGQATVDAAERKALYGRSQQIIMDEAAVLPIFDQIGYNGVGKDVHGVRTDARGWYRWFYDTWIG
jgi:peptide/nickel transport system substrate-binding protein